MIVAHGLAALIAERQAHRDAARLALTSALTPEAFAKLQRSFDERLDATGLDRSDKDEQSKQDAENLDSHPNFREYGRARIRKQFARLHKRAVSLYRPHESEPLHDLRIEAKRLRYALELFGICWGGELSFAADHVSDLHGAVERERIEARAIACGEDHRAKVHRVFGFCGIIEVREIVHALCCSSGVLGIGTPFVSAAARRAAKPSRSHSDHVARARR